MVNFPCRSLILPQRYWRVWGLSISTLIFVYLAILVWHHPTALDWDQRLLLAIHTTAHPYLDQAANILTKLGIYWGVVPVVLGVSVTLLIQRQWRSLIYLLATCGGTAAINSSAKALFHRVRPHLWEAAPHKTSFAFPSGHAMSSMTLVVALIILLWGTRWAAWALVSGSGFVLIIAWTRLYLGVHYPSDILAGWMLSLVWAIVVSWIVFPEGAELSGSNAAPTTQPPSRSQARVD